MNCANHADASAVAYCRTCGKALCANCTRPVRGVIYCEDCLGAKMEGTVPPGSPAFTPVSIGSPSTGATTPPATPFAPVPPPPGVSSGPNPALAGIMAGVFPFGVGAVYNGQYAKGLAHLVIFGMFIAVLSHNDSTLVGVVGGLGISFFYVYQIIDAVRSARALQLGQPAPDPFGLAQSFSVGDKIDPKNVPTGAVVLIVIGVFFLLHTMGVFDVSIGRFWPVLLIGLGAWLVARNFGMLGPGYACSDPRMATRRLMGPAMLMTVGILLLLENLHVAGFGHTWPIILLVIGGVKLLQGSAVDLGSWNVPGAGPTPPGDAPPPPPAPPAPPSEVSHG